MTTKPFDCMETVEQIQEEIQERLESMSREEQLAFWRAQTTKLRARQQSLQTRRDIKLPEPKDV